MRYIRTTWEDRKTVVNATRMNNIEQGLVDASSQINSIQDNVDTLNTHQENTFQRLNKMESELGYVSTHILADGTDFNSLITNGKYRIYNGINAPTNAQDAFLIDVIKDEDSISQIAYLKSSSAQCAVYQRTYAQGQWGAWVKFIGNVEFKALSDKVDTNIVDIRNLDSRVTTNEGEISNIKQNITEVETDIAGIHKALGDGEGSSGNSLTARVTINESEIASLKRRTTTNETDISSLKGEDTAIKGRLDDLESKVTTDTETLRNEFQTNLTNTKNELQSNIDGVATTAQENLENAKTEIQGKIDEVASNAQNNLDNAKAELQEDINTKHQTSTTEIVNIKEVLEELKSKDTEINEDLQAHKVDTNAHTDIREKMGKNENLMTTAKDLVGAINEIYMSGGSGGTIAGVLSGSEKLIRITATEPTNTFDTGIVMNPNITNIYLMGLRLFLGKDYTIEGSVITLKYTVLKDEYIDIFVREEVVIDLSNGTYIEYHERFTATEETSTFTIEQTIGKGTVEIYQEGVRLYEGYDYTLDRPTRVVTLVQPLEVGEYVDYTIKMNAGTNITEIYDTIEEVIAQKENIALLPSIVENVNSSIKSIEATEVDNQIKITKNDGSIENIDIKGISSSELEEVKTSINNMKDGQIEGSLKQQIDNNAQQINVLNNKIQIEKVKIESAVDLNTLIDLDKIWVTNSTRTAQSCSNIPIANITTFSVKNIECFYGYNKYFTQLLVTDKNLIFSRYYNNGTFSTWIPITGVTSTLTLLNGWSINAKYDDLVVSRSGDLVNIHGVLKNNSAIASGSVIATLPDIYKPSILRRSFGVSIDSKIPVAIDVNTSGGIVWYGGALDSVKALFIDITYSV